MTSDTSRDVLPIQGLYFLVTGLWPILHMSSFLKVTGKKTDLWLVKTVGALVAAMGVGFLVEAKRQGRPAPGMRMIAGGSAAALTAVDTIYAVTNRISKVYLADALVEFGLSVFWLRRARTADV